MDGSPGQQPSTLVGACSAFGPECRGKTRDQWAHRHQGQLAFIEAGKPVQDAHIESFNGKCRDDCSSETWFVSLADAQQPIEA